MIQLRKSAKYFIMKLNKSLINQIMNYRAKDLELLSSYLKEGHKLWWYEERRQGKKTLISGIRNNHPEWRIIYLDIFLLQNQEDFVLKYAAAQASQLFKEFTSVPDLVRECKKYFKSLYPKVSEKDGKINLEFTLEGDIGSALKEVLSAPQKYADANKKENVVVILNDFEQIKNISLDLLNSFADILPEQDISYTFLSANKAAMEEFFSEGKSGLNNLAQRFTIRPFSEDEWRGIVMSAFEAETLKVPQKVTNLIIEWSQLQMHYIFQFCNRVVNLLDQAVDLNTESERFLNELVQEEESFFKELFDNLTANQKKGSFNSCKK